MSLSITQQKIKGGHEVLMVRDGSIRLLTFPLSMRSLANEMCLEGNELDEEQYPVLVKKYQGKRLEQARKPAQSTTHWTLPTSPVVGVEQEPERIVTDDPLAALLTAAREAEIVLAFRKGEFTKAKAELSEAEGVSWKAWEAFNKALRLSLPESTHVKGISISTGFIEALEQFVQGKSEEE